MYLIVGLGNPGEQYAHTRHNAGFDAVAHIARKLGASYWKNECGAQTAKVTLQGHDIILAMPQSFMNVSGGPVKQLCKAYSIDLEKLVIIHDDLDIEPGSIRVKFGGGLAGHNGLKSIAEKLGTRDWHRIRIGIGRPPGRMDTADYVLTIPRKEALAEFEDACRIGSEAALFLIENGLQATQQEYN